MKPKILNRPKRFREDGGFALVVSLSLMVLLTVLVVGLLSLSSLTLRAGQAGEARAEAQANARLALMLALGELQSSMGPDQRVSARASALDERASEPNLTGAWQSWHWDPGSGANPSYSDKTKGFKGWLVSTPQPEDRLEQNLASSSLKDPVWLINPATTGTPSGTSLGASLRADRVRVNTDSRTGGFAWAVMDESQKAPFHLKKDLPTDDGEKIARYLAPDRARAEEVIPALSPDTLTEPAKVVSLQSAVVAVGQEKGKQLLSYQQDLTPYSMGLLTNVVDGGLMTDLTPLFESSVNLASSSALDSISPYPKSVAGDSLANAGANGAPTWDYLRSHYSLHKKIAAGTAASGAPTIRLATADLRPSTTGINQAPTEERLMPVIAKLQIMFSIATHYSHIPERVQFYNDKGEPKGNTNYGAPHLIYDPVVTLYNPYDVAIELQRLRVRIWDPPVLLGFQKNGIWLRSEFAQSNGNGFMNLARFQIDNEHLDGARRYFNLVLGGGTPNSYAGRIRLEPGEVKVFSPRVETNWTWGLETADPWNPRSFFDWKRDSKFGEQDNRTKNQMGIEAIPGWDPRAGLQTDHLSYGSGRPDSTRYPFEIANNWNGGWLGIKLTDSFTAQAKAGISASQPTFEVDLLAGNVADTSRDLLRTYKFRFANPTDEMSENPQKPIISRTFLVKDLLQTPGDKSPGGKTPFAILSMTAKTTVDPLDNAMPWLHNHPVVEGTDQDTSKVNNALDAYDVRLQEVSDFNTFPGIEMDPDTKRGFYGASSTANRGVSNVPMFRVPLMPAASLGDLIPANLVSGAKLPRVTHAFGNSRSHPLIPTGGVTQASPAGLGGLMLDHSYFLNDALWDRYFFSTAADYPDGLLKGTNRLSLLQDFFKGDRTLLNPRFTPLLLGSGSPEQQAKDLDGLSPEDMSHKMASAIAIEGPFNVNSDSVSAWKAMLSSLRDAELIGWTKRTMTPNDKTAFPRMSLPIAGDGEAAANSGTLDVQGQVRWAGVRALTDDQIDKLANAIVEQIRLRGKEDKAPFTTLGEFVNRRIGGSGGLHVNSGLLQTAIARTQINDNANQKDSKTLTTAAGSMKGLISPSARTGFSAEGAPSTLTQGDLLMALAPVITVRGDTFRIRAYGESRNKDNEVVSKAWCEAIVQRMPEYLDSKDLPEIKTDKLQSNANKNFGRRIDIVSFRWLSPDEV